jgi:hypothetical protein
VESSRQTSSSVKVGGRRQDALGRRLKKIGQRCERVEVRAAKRCGVPSWSVKERGRGREQAAGRRVCERMLSRTGGTKTCEVRCGRLALRLWLFESRGLSSPLPRDDIVKERSRVAVGASRPQTRRNHSPSTESGATPPLGPPPARSSPLSNLRSHCLTQCPRERHRIVMHN